MTPRLFALHRTRDETGVSGTGVVAYGTQYPNGKCTLSWETGLASVAVYDSIELVEKIHGHNGATQIVWLAGDDDAVSRVLDERDRLREMVAEIIAEREHWKREYARVCRDEAGAS